MDRVVSMAVGALGTEVHSGRAANAPCYGTFELRCVLYRLARPGTAKRRMAGAERKRDVELQPLVSGYVR
jgi:hypothetical protein